MLQKSLQLVKTNKNIDQFYIDVEALGLRFPVAVISEATGINKSNISRVLSRKLEPSGHLLEKFYEKFPKGGKIVPHESVVSEPQETYLAKRQQLKNSGEKRNVPVYGGFTTLGNIEVIDDDNMKNRVVAELPADVFPGCNYAEKAKGDSMYPLIMNQALLVGKICNVKGITFGEKYIIKTKDGLDTTKYVHPGETSGTIKLKAYNKSIPEQLIEIADIIFCCRVQWIINPT